MLCRASMTLVRPDQHVAWRGETFVADALRRATGHGSDGA